MTVDSGALSGSHASHEARSGLRPPGFDPARIERKLDALIAISVLTYAIASYRPRRRTIGDWLWDML